MATPIKGIYVPHVVPLDEKGRVDEDELRRYLNWLIERGVDGLYPNGSTGEFPRFTPEERRRVVQIACETSAGRVPVLAGAAEANIKETINACHNYADYGARAVAIVSPYYYRLSPEATYAYFQEIASQSPIDVTLYNIPSFATPLDVATIRRLSELDRIVGIKDSSGDISFMMRLIRAICPNRPDFAFLTGWEPTLMPMLMMGAVGGTHATAGVTPELTKRIYELTVAEQYNAAKRLQNLLIGLFDGMLAAGDFPAGFRAGVEARGFNVGASRQPLCDAKVEDKEKIMRQISETLEQLKEPSQKHLPQIE